MQKCLKLKKLQREITKKVSKLVIHLVYIVSVHVGLHVHSYKVSSKCLE